MVAAIALDCSLGNTASHAIPTNRRHLKGVINARTQNSTLYYSIARTPGPGAKC